MPSKSTNLPPRRSRSDIPEPSTTGKSEAVREMERIKRERLADMQRGGDRDRSDDFSDDLLERARADRMRRFGRDRDRDRASAGAASRDRDFASVRDRRAAAGRGGARDRSMDNEDDLMRSVGRDRDRAADRDRDSLLDGLGDFGDRLPAGARDRLRRARDSASAAAAGGAGGGIGASSRDYLRDLPPEVAARLRDRDIPSRTICLVRRSLAVLSNKRSLVQRRTRQKIGRAHV